MIAHLHPRASLWVWIGVLLFALSGIGSQASAHSFAPTVISLTEESEGSFRIAYLPPANGEAMTPSFPSHCVLLPRSETDTGADVGLAGRVLSCGSKGLSGHPLSMQGSELGETLLTIHFRSGEVHSALLHRESHRIPTRDKPDSLHFTETARRFALLGVQHILTGFDHLLLLFGLLLLVPSVSALLLTVTAFTVGHSLTLALASLQIVSPPAQLAEALIALSVAFVARELVCPQPTLSALRPSLLAILFGLLHGLGFASALRETAIPSQQVLLSLVSFNVGVEAGQLLFVVALLLPVRWFRRRQLLPVCGYVMGSLAMAWTLERTLLLFGKGLSS